MNALGLSYLLGDIVSCIKRILNAYIRYDRAVEIRKEKDRVIIQINNRKEKTFIYFKLNDFNTTGTMNIELSSWFCLFDISTEL
jgi:hypothetical protein